MQDETRLPYPRRMTKVCSRTVRATFTAYGSPVYILINPNFFSFFFVMIPKMDHRIIPNVLSYDNICTVGFVFDLKGPFAHEILYIETLVCEHV